MKSDDMPRILCVDDEPRILDGLARVLRNSYSVTTAASSVTGLKAVDEEGPFAVVMSDLRMPGMDGIAFLSQVRQVAPETVRVLLTGQADVNSAIGAVNLGAVFRFLAKPSTPEALHLGLAAAVDQYRLITAERVLLRETVHGSINAVTEILGLANPAAFGRALRAKTLVGELSEKLDPDHRWQIEIAAMLSQVGSVILSSDTVEKLYRGAALSIPESLAVARLPRIAADMIGHIPRMEDIRDILLNLDRIEHGVSEKGADGSTQDVPLGGRILKVALDFDILESGGLSGIDAIETLRGRNGRYDSHVLDVLADRRGGAPVQAVLEVELRLVLEGSILVHDLKTETGILLAARGQEVTERMVDRFRTLSGSAARQLVHVTRAG